MAGIVTTRTGATTAGASRSAGRAGRMVADDVTLLLCDSRSAASRALLGDHSVTALDVAEQSVRRWQELRTRRCNGAVAGLTAWSDLVQARGLLQERGLRMRLEQRRGQLFYWEMA